MSLVAHWKLDGDTKDSVSGNNGSGSPTYVDGKIGQGIDSTGERITVENTGGIKSALNGNHFTLSMWWRQYDNSTYRWRDSIEVDGKRLERGRGDDGNTAADFWCNIGSGDGNQLFNSAISGVDGTEWFHIVVRRNGDDYEVWVNGEITNSGTRTTDMSNSGNLEIDHQTNGTEMDDIRLYDHAISEKKIQQLSQAKVLHYKLDSHNPEQLHKTNTLDTGSSTPHGIGYDPVNDYIICTDDSPQIARFEANTLSKVDDTSVPWAGNYVIGVAYDSELDVFWMMDWGNKDVVKVNPSDFSEINRYNMPSNPNGSQDSIGFALDDSGHLYGSMRDEYIGRWDKEDGSNAEWMNIESYVNTDFEGQGIEWNDGILYIGNSDYANSGRGNLYTCEWKKSVSQFGTLSISNDTSGFANANGTLHISSRDSTKQERYYIGGNVTDASGYENTGKLNGPGFTTSSKAGSGAYKFSGAGDLIGSSLYYDTTNVGELTVSAWYNSSSTSQHIIASSDRNEYWRLGVGSDGVDGVQWTVNSSDMVSTASKSSLQDGNWHHILAVFDTSLTNDHKIYIDGELDSQESHFNSGIGSGAVSYTHIGVGSEASFQSGSTGPNDWMDGKLDDVRVYHSALSASEVQEVYEQRASIDSGGNFHSHELLDTPSSEQTADENEWELGTSGSQGSFSQNGFTSENDIIEYPDPFGKLVPTWRCSPDSNSNADGGWNMDFQGDNSDRLRFSVFVKRTGDSMNGSYYHGCDNGGNTLKLDGSTDGNPYFHSGNLPETNQWYLLVGILHPNSYSGGQGDVTGVYDMNGKKLSGGTDYKWGTGSRQEMRDYLYYSTDTSERQYFVYPRIDVVDGSEPDIASLVNGLDSRTNNQRDMNLTAEGTLEADLNEVGPASGSLVGWWPLDGDTRDYAGNANGTNNGASVTGGLGQSAYEFSGTDPSDVDLPQVTKLAPEKAVTVMLWANADTTGSTQTILLTGRDINSGVEFRDDTLKVHCNSGTFEDSISTINTGEWTHMVLTYQSGVGGKTYLNGSESSSTGDLGDIVYPEFYGSAPTIGSHGGIYNFDGKIQDVRVYNRALTAKEVETLYNLTDPRQNQQVVQTDNGLVHTKHEYDERL